jgi:hypothetical protein
LNAAAVPENEFTREQKVTVRQQHAQHGIGTWFELSEPSAADADISKLRVVREEPDIQRAIRGSGKSGS